MPGGISCIKAQRDAIYIGDDMGNFKILKPGMFGELGVTNSFDKVCNSKVKGIATDRDTAFLLDERGQMKMMGSSMPIQGSQNPNQQNGRPQPLDQGLMVPPPQYDNRQPVPSSPSKKTPGNHPSNDNRGVGLQQPPAPGRS